MVFFFPESFSSYFSKYGEIVDSVIMMDKVSGRPRGFGFVTFVDAEVASKVLQEEHVIDGRVVGFTFDKITIWHPLLYSFPSSYRLCTF